MKIRKATHYTAYRPGQKGLLSNICEEGNKVAETKNIRVGSCSCKKCPLFWFRFKNFVFCHTNKEEKPVKETGSPMIHLVKDEA